MFKPAASLQGQFTLCSCFDQALDLPEVPDVSDAELATLPEDEQQRIKKLRAEAETKMRNMREGAIAWTAKPNHELTFFTFRRIRGTELTWLRDEIARRGMVTSDARFELVFRLAIESIVNCPGVSLEFETVNGIQLAKLSSLDPVYDIGKDAKQPELGRAIIVELGSLVMERAVSGVPPKS